ncbi:MAG: hypothetical protein CMJ31_12650 [Phycisphaerae bacterium]|nr:hypothetical protein [Phycisphaerae bacterium]
MPPVFIAMLPALLPVLLVAVPLVLLIALDRFPWMPIAARVMVVVVVCVAGLWLAVGPMVRGYKRGTDVRGLPLAMDEAARVNVSCWNDQRRELEPIGDEAFEPERFRILIPTPYPAWLSNRVSAGRLRMIQSQAMSILGSFLYVPAFLGHGWLSVWFLALAAPVVVYAYRKPTYLRIVPGWVDILRYPIFGGADAQPEIKRIAVGQLPVRLDLKSHALRVGPWTKDQVPKIVGTNAISVDPALFTLPLWPIVGRHEAIRAIYRACVSTAEAGPLE